MITVLTEKGEKCFGATKYKEDGDYLVVYDGDTEVARFAPGKWDGVHLDQASSQIVETAPH